MKVEIVVYYKYVYYWILYLKMFKMIILIMFVNVIIRINKRVKKNWVEGKSVIIFMRNKKVRVMLGNNTVSIYYGVLRYLVFFIFSFLIKGVWGI